MAGDETARVMLLTTELRPGGAERIVYELARGVDPSRFAMSVAALDGRGEYAERIRAAGREVLDLRARSRFDLGVVTRLRQVLRKRRIELLHTHLLHANIVGRLAARGTGIPVISTCHIAERRRVPWHFWLERLTAGLCRTEVCVSRAALARQREKTGLPESFFRIIHNGVDLTRFRPGGDKNAARAALGLPQEALVLGALGRFDRQKGFDVFLRAAALAAAADAGSELYFALAGYGEEEPLRRLAASLRLGPRLRFAGYAGEPERFYAALDLCAVPSRWEGFGLVAAEALGCGVPVVASRVDSLPELVRDGVDGLLVAPDDPEALAQALLELAHAPDRRAAMSAAAVARAQEFGLDKMLRNYEELYAAVLRNRTE